MMKIASCLFWCLFWLVLCIVAMIALLEGIAAPSAERAPASIVNDIKAPPGQGAYLARGRATIARAHIDAILCAAKSPACGTGQELYDMALQSGVNPAFELAIFEHESVYGKAGVATVTRSLGNIRCAGYTACYQGYRAYRSWIDGYKDFNTLMSREYFSRGLITVEQIIPVYAPGADHNNVSAYVGSVEAAMRVWETRA